MLRDFAAALGQTLRAAEGASRKLYGFAEHQLQSTFLGTSAGLRLRHDQPTGRVELNAKSADMARSAWTFCRPATSPTWTSPALTPA